MPTSETTITFTTLDLPEPLNQGLAAAGFTQCTPIQAKALPTLLRGQDVAGQAQTGTGKTAAFLIALLTRLLREPAADETRQPRALILAPTRELVQQIHKDALLLGQTADLRFGVAFGGTDYEKQRRHLSNGVDVLIGTPGRLIDFYKQGVFDFNALTAVVLDEADRMFDLGFIRDVRYLFRRMPPPHRRLSMLFSATLSYRVTELAYEHMNNPVLVSTEAGQVAVERISELVYYPANEEKIPLLLGLIEHHQPDRAIVFANTKHATETVLTYLEANRVSAGSLSGDVPQRKRQHLIETFSNGELAVMVATDVASRGLHIPDVSHVFNFDLPQTAEDYVHRIGRTARAGAAGMAISFACEDTAFSLPEIEQFVGHKLPALTIDPALLVVPQRPAKSAFNRASQPTRHPRAEASKRSQPPQRKPPMDSGQNPTANDSPAAFNATDTTSPTASPSQCVGDVREPTTAPTQPTPRKRRRRPRQHRHNPTPLDGQPNSLPTPSIPPGESL